MRVRSFQAFVVSTTSRASKALVSHSGAYSEQNSVQPIGARAVLPTEMNSTRSFAALAAGTASAPASAVATMPAASIPVGLHCILWPLPVLEATFLTNDLNR